MFKKTKKKTKALHKEEMGYIKKLEKKLKKLEKKISKNKEESN